jgi:hypothetical protein
MIAGAVSIFQRPLSDHAVWPVPAYTFLGDRALNDLRGR